MLEVMSITHRVPAIWAQGGAAASPPALCTSSGCSRREWSKPEGVHCSRRGRRQAAHLLRPARRFRRRLMGLLEELQNHGFGIG